MGVRFFVCVRKAIFNVDDPEPLCVCVCLGVCVCVCVGVGASESSETIEVIIVKLGTDIGMHHVINISTFTFIQGHTDLSHGNNECLIISETV